MIYDFILSFLFGLLGHQSKRVTRSFPNGWENIADHGIGGAMLIVAVPYWYRRLKMPDGWQRAMAATALACLGTGAGVVAGWVIEK